MARIIASADVGSNTAHLLVARTDGATLIRLVNRNDWLALGEVVTRQGKIPNAHVSRIVATLKTFKAVASKALAESIFVFATDAMRTASNRDEVMRTIRDKTGLTVNLITPEQEAFLGLRGVTLDLPAKQRAMLFELGGGSAQVACVEGPKIIREVSLPIGTGRLIAEADMRNPCPVESVIKAEGIIRDAIAQCGDFDPAESTRPKSRWQAEGSGAASGALSIRTANVACSAKKSITSLGLPHGCPPKRWPDDSG
jgi:exopolyphosphatase/guanosine-5'-triphosphate,3'-diphosphate pyrophosphatase